MYLVPQFGNYFYTLHVLSFPSQWCSVKPFQVALVFVLPFVHLLEDGQVHSSHLLPFFFFKVERVLNSLAHLGFIIHSPHVKLRNFLMRLFSNIITVVKSC